MSQVRFNKKEKSAGSGRPNYLRYDDVFMSKDHSNNRRIANSQQYRDIAYNNNGLDYQSDDDVYETIESNQHQERGYFSPGSNIMDDRMVYYQKRQLPKLQRYDAHGRDFRQDSGQLSCWDLGDEYPPRRKRSNSFGGIWHRFVVTFASILSLVCVSWIAYNWNADHKQRSAMQPVMIEPDHPSFRVLPDDPGGPNIPHKGRSVYKRMDPGASSIHDDESLLPPQEVRVDLPNSSDSSSVEIEENAIIDDRVYYIKMSAGKSKQVLEGELKLLRKKFAGVLDGVQTSVKMVSNPKGEQKRAILIGPFGSQDSALDVARNIGDQCYIVSVKE
jgi:hypothetical protein